MKKSILTKMMVVAIACMVIACGNDDEELKIPKIEPNNTELVFTSDGGTKEISVTNYDSWIIKGMHDNVTDKNGNTINTVTVQATNTKKMSDGWLKATVVSKNGKENYLSLEVQKNGSSLKRDKYVSMSCGQLGVAVHVIQEGK